MPAFSVPEDKRKSSKKKPKRNRPGRERPGLSLIQPQRGRVSVSDEPAILSVVVCVISGVNSFRSKLTMFMQLVELSIQITRAVTNMAFHRL